MAGKKAAIAEEHGQIIAALRSARSLTMEVGSIRPIVQGVLEDEVADSPTKSTIYDATGKPLGVLSVSNAVKPGLVERATDRALQAREALGPDLGDVVLRPMARGIFGGLTYTLWPWCRVLSSQRLVRIAQREILKPRVFKWLRQVTQRNAVGVPGEDLEAAFAHPLERMAADERFPARMRDAARRSAQRLAAGQWRPRFSFVHNDLWLGNFLLPRDRHACRMHRHGFVVIDWASINTRGYPFIDLLRFGRTSRISKRRLYQEVRRHSEIVGCAEEDAAGYLLVTIGASNTTHDHFPEARFLEASQGLFDSLSDALSRGSSAVCQ